MNAKKIVNVLIVVLVYLAFALILWPFKQAILFAILFSFALNPLLKKMKSFKKIKLTNVNAITILILGLIGVLLLPLSIIIIRAISSLKKIDINTIGDSSAVHKVLDTGSDLFTYVAVKLQNFGYDLNSQVDIKGMGIDAVKNMLSALPQILSNAPTALFHFLIFLILVYYFLMNQEKLKSNLVQPHFLTSSQVERFSEIFESICHLVLISTVVIAFLQATVVTLACLIAGLEGSVIIFMIAFFMAFVPVIGSAPLTISLLIYTVINGQYGAAVILAIGAGLAASLDNVIKAYLFSSKEDSASPVISLLTLIGSLSVFGVLGLFLGPIITELTMKIGKIIHEE